MRRRVRVRAHYRLVGTSKIAYDRKRKAKKPGKRRSRRGNVYYEYRRNRADASTYL